MATQAKQKKSSRKRYAPEFRAEALTLAARVGIPEAARQLGIDGALIYGWRARQRLAQSTAEVDQQMAAENARLKRQLAEQAEELAILKKAAAYFAKQPK
jgi:transposase